MGNASERCVTSPIMNNISEISAFTLKGLCPISLCWRFLRDVSAQLEPIHKSGRAHGNVSLRHIVVREDKFLLMSHEAVGGVMPESDIWQLAASAFELLLGVPLFNGAGESSQKKDTPIPVIPYPEAEDLNELLHRCLNCRKSDRPSVSEIKKEADGMVKTIEGKKRMPRQNPIVKETQSFSKIDRQWPERMQSGVARGTLVVLLIALSTSALFSQVSSKTIVENVSERLVVGNVSERLVVDDEEVILKLLNATLMLRHSDENHWNQAKDELEKRITQFTLMNELQDHANDCPLVSSRVKTFGVNRIVTELKKGSRVQNTGRELLDGADSRFHYSIYEKAVRCGRTATYKLSGRYGRQVFLIVPFDPAQVFSAELVKEDGTVIPFTGKDENGVLYFRTDANEPREGEMLTLKITNGDNKADAAFVVINHNYRNR